MHLLLDQSTGLAARGSIGFEASRHVHIFGLERNARAGRLTAVDLIEAAIASGRLAENTLEDRSYVQAVGDVLRRVVKN